MNMKRVKLFEDFMNEFQIPSNKWIDMDLKKIDKDGLVVDILVAKHGAKYINAVFESLKRLQMLGKDVNYRPY